MKRLVLFLMAMLAGLWAYGQGDGGSGTPDVSPLPDLTVVSMLARVDWVRAHAGDERFLRLLRADLQRVADETRSSVYVRQLLPGVNYVLVHCRPAVASTQESPNDEAGNTGSEPKPGRFAPVLEEVRRRVMDFPYVLFCGYNPVDDYRPVEWHEADGGQWHRPQPAEVVTGELVVALNGRVLPTIEMAAEFEAGLERWNASVMAGFGVVGEDGAVLQELGRLVRFLNGHGEASCSFPVRPGHYAVFVHVDPENDVRERDESNNRTASRVAVPAVLVRLTVDEWPGPRADAPLELLPLETDSPDGLVGRSATDAPALAVLPTVDTGAPPFSLGFANASDAPVTFGLREVHFALDGEPATVIWLLDADDTDPAPPATDRLVLPPGRDMNRRFRLAGDVPAGDHRLVVKVESLELRTEVSFLTHPPQSSVNLFPVADGAEVRDIRLASDPGNPDLHNMLRDRSWQAFSSANTALADVAVIARHDLPWDANTLHGTREGAANGEGMPVRAWDVEVVLRFAAGSPSPDLLEAYLRSLRDQWFVDDAWLLPGITMYAGQEDPNKDGEAAAMPLLESVYRVALDYSDVDRVVSYVRVQVPVVMATENEPDGEPFRPRLRQLVAVDVSPVPHTDAAGGPRDDAVLRPYWAYVDFRAPGRLPAVAYFPQFPDSSWFEVRTDPEGRIPEWNEDDNVCHVHRGPAPEPVFEAEAWVNWGPTLDMLTTRELVLTVEGVLRNPTPEPLSLRFPSTLQLDFSWEDRYRWSEGKVFASVITEVEVGAGDQHVWSLRVPLGELWAVIARLGGLGREAPPFVVLDVELVGTDFRAGAEVRVPEWNGSLDEDQNLLPDAWEAEYGADPGGGGEEGHHAEDDLDGDGWNNLQEFLKNTDPTDPDSAPLGRLFRLALFSGWNLVSLPVYPDDADIGAALGEAITGPVWEWAVNALTGGGEYRRTEVLEPHTPYWMFTRKDVEVAIPGTPHAVDTVRMNEGWTAVGAGGPLNLPDRVRERASILYWDAKAQGYSENLDGVLEEGLGYWISLPEPVEVRVWGD